VITPLKSPSSHPARRHPEEPAILPAPGATRWGIAGRAVRETLRRAGTDPGLSTAHLEIFAGGLHEYLTEFLDSMQQLSSNIQRSFFSSTTVE
jgi:uncharacterized alpha-E superfamily protein